MTRNTADWAYLTDESGRYYYHFESGEKQYPDGSASSDRSGTTLFAIPSRDVVSTPLWVNSKDDALISQVVAMENEKLGLNSKTGPGSVSDWKPVELNGTRTLIQSISIPWQLEAPESEKSSYTAYLPQYALYPPPANGVALWKENGDWVAGYSRGRKWIHIQTLGADSLSILASELRLTQWELSAKGFIEDVQDCVVWGDYDLKLHEILQAECGFEVSFEALPAPVTEDVTLWKLEPHTVTQKRIERRRVRRAISIGLLVLFLIGALIAAAALHLDSIGRSNELLRSKIEEHQTDADGIASAMEKWEVLSPAVEASRSPLEIFYRISKLLPERGFRLTAFEMLDHRTVIVRGEGSNMGNALQLKGALEKDPDLSDYLWEVPPPQSRNSLTQLVATGTYRYSQP